MNPRLRGLLDRLGLPDADAPDLWRRTVLFKNYGSIPLPPDVSDEAAARGFLLLVLDEDGRPRHFAKCRPARDQDFERECRILERLAGDPELEEILLPVRTGRAGPLRVHLSAYLDEPRYDAVAPERDLAGWLDDTRAVLRAARRLCRRAVAGVPGIAPGRERVRPAREAGARIRRLADRGVDRAMLERVARPLADVELPSEAQHGDLWPGNAFTTPDGTPRRLVDLERVGRIDVPLFDLFHWLWSSAWLLDRREPGSWLPFHPPPETRSADGDGLAWSRVARELIGAEARRAGLDGEQVGAALLFSVLEMAAHRLRPGAPSSYARPLIRDLEALDRRLREAAEPAGLVGPDVTRAAATRTR